MPTVENEQIQYPIYEEVKPKSFLRQGEKPRCKHCGSNYCYSLKGRRKLIFKISEDGSKELYEASLFYCRSCDQEFDTVPVKATAGLVEALADKSKRLEVLGNLFGNRK